MKPNAIKQYRLDSGLTQDQLAEQLGVSRALVSLYEIGKRVVTAEQARVFEERTNGGLTRERLRPDVFGPMTPRAVQAAARAA